MNKICLIIWLSFLFTHACFSQVTVTNATNTTPNLAVTYTSLANALTALNGITAINGPVIITLNAGNPTETAPLGGYTIQFTAATTAANNITIDGNGNTIRSFGALTPGSVNDAIIKLIGADYITIQNFTMQENAANTTTALATNNMTEWGVALLHASVTDGAQNNTIQNNTISLNRDYANSFGIYSNTRHSATVVDIVQDITNNTTAPNNNNKVYGNTISNVNMGITFIGSNTAANQDVGNDIGGSSLATGNSITNWGGAAAATAYVSNSVTSYCIYVNNQTSENVSYNTITSAAVSGTAVEFRGIYKNYTRTPTGTFTSTISYNTLTLSSAFTSGFFRVIESADMGSPLSTATININNNNILNCVITGAAASTYFIGIFNTASPGTLNMNYNVISGTGSTATTGGFIAIYNLGSVVNNINITHNQIGNAGADAVTFSVATSGSISGIQNSAAGSTAVLNIINNTVDRLKAVGCNGATTIIYQTGAAGTININNNALGTTTGNLITYNNSSGSIDGILNSGGGAATTLNINDNSMDGVSVLTCASFIPIRNLVDIGVAINIEHNLLGSASGTLITTSGAQLAGIYGIYNLGGTSATAVSIQYNDIKGIVHSVVASCNHQYILNTKAVASNTISNNTFTNLSINTTGSVTMIAKSGAMIAGATSTINNNSIVGIFNKSSAGNVTMYSSSSASVTGSTVTVSGNNFSNVTVAGLSDIEGIQDLEGALASAPSKIFSGNIFNNISAGNGIFRGLYIVYGTGVSIISNTISNVSVAGDMYGIVMGSNYGAGTCSVESNTITACASTGGSMYGINGNNSGTTVFNVNSNTISGLSTSAASASLVGITFGSGETINIYDNIINTLNGSGTFFSLCNGIAIANGVNINIYRNRIYTLTETASNLFNQPSVNGIYFGDNAGIATVYNNFVSDLQVPNANLTDAVRGIGINSSTANTTFNLYYNSVYLNAVSNASNFGTAGIYHLGNATATTAQLNMINNIIVNTSIAKGAGLTTAYLGSGMLTNYASTSDYNNFYAGTPGPVNVIYFDHAISDQTLAAYQTRVTPRDANSISVLPNFTSATDLHLITANCQVDGRGIPVAGITTDIDGAVRNITTPDIGADEFMAATSTALAGIIGSTVCEDRTVSVTGTVYTANNCNLISYVLPSGGSAVSGKINVCVTLDASQLSHNGEPYVQRHYDIEPTVSDLTTTSATITLYFTDAEFALYNTNNPAWPELPTVANNTVTTRGNLKVTQFHGVGSTSPTKPGFYPGGRVLIVPGEANVSYNGSYWEVTFPVTGFSGFYVHTNYFNTPLPVSFNYLNGHKQDSTHVLNWKVTCNSTPRATMTLQRSADARTFSDLYSIAADAARCSSPFDYTDANPLTGMNYYRLKIVDADGKITYSSTVALLNAVKGFDIISIAPNPVVSGNFKLNVASAQAGKMDLTIIDMQGRLVNRQTISLIAGFNSLPVNIGNLASGTYALFASIGEDKSRVVRFVKQ